MSAGLLHLVGAIWDFWVYRFHFLGMPVSKYVWTRFANHLKSLLVSKVIPNQKFVGIKIANIIGGLVYQNPNKAKFHKKENQLKHSLFIGFTVKRSRSPK